jgi:hypothetical protein
MIYEKSLSDNNLSSSSHWSFRIESVLFTRFFTHRGLILHIDRSFLNIPLLGLPASLAFGYAIKPNVSIIDC